MIYLSAFDGFREFRTGENRRLFKMAQPEQTPLPDNREHAEHAPDLTNPDVLRARVVEEQQRARKVEERSNGDLQQAIQRELDQATHSYKDGWKDIYHEPLVGKDTDKLLEYPGGRRKLTAGYSRDVMLAQNIRNSPDAQRMFKERFEDRKAEQNQRLNELGAIQKRILERYRQSYPGKEIGFASAIGFDKQLHMRVYVRSRAPAFPPEKLPQITITSREIMPPSFASRFGSAKAAEKIGESAINAAPPPSPAVAADSPRPPEAPRGFMGFFKNLSTMFSSFFERFFGK